jgi:hypothetical protein
MGHADRPGARLTHLHGITLVYRNAISQERQLHGKLSTGLDQVWSIERGMIMPVHTIPIDGEKVGQLFSLITRALLWHHWQATLESDRHSVWAGFLNSIGLQLFSQFFAANANARVRENLGEGTFIYEGVQGTDIPEMSLWLFSIYGRMKLSGDASAPNDDWPSSLSDSVALTSCSCLCECG